MMKRLLFVFFLFAGIARGQATTVSGTIVDLGGQAWAQGTYTFTFRVAPSNPASTYYWNGAPLTLAQQTIAGHMDNTGSFSVSVPSNTSITPAQSTWDIQVCPLALGNSPCYTVKSITITGATQSLSSTVRPPPIAIDLAHPAYPFVVAYTQPEIVTAPTAGLYWDWTSQHYWYCFQVNPTGQVQNYGTCAVWKELCQVGDGLCGGGGGGPHNLLSTTHLDTIPASPPTRGDIITGQNLTSPASITPSWARLGLGTNTQFLMSNATDALWGNVIAGTNISITSSTPGSSPPSITINATAGGTGCTLPGTDRGVLSEHPVGHCYDSLDWTWNDDHLAQIMQSGDGTNSLTDVISTENAWAFGTNISVTSDDAGFGMSNLFLNGQNIKVSESAASADIEWITVLGAASTTNGQRIAATNSSGVSIAMCLLDGCQDKGAGNNAQRGIWADASGSNINVVFDVGVQNGVQANTGANDSSVFVIGEQNKYWAQNGCNMSDNFTLGELNSFTCETASTAAPAHNTIIGNNSSVDSSTQQVFYATLAGNTNTVTQNSGVNIANIGLFGNGLTATNCSDCYLYGRNGSTSTSQYIGIGLGTTPEIQITPGNVKRTPEIFASLPTCNAGTEGSINAVTDSSVNTWGSTVTGGGANHVLAYCDGTNWTVAAK
jgi:hypothetical protein